MKYIVNSNDLEWEPKFFPGEDGNYGEFKALWKKHESKQFEVRITKIPPGGTNTKYHAHTKEEEWFYVLNGRCHICIEGEWQLIKEGDSIFKPIGIYHIFRNFGEEPCELIMMGTNIAGSTAIKLPEPESPNDV